MAAQRTARSNGNTRLRVAAGSRYGPHHDVEYHTISREGPLPESVAVEMRRSGFHLYSVVPPCSEQDKRHDFHFRRTRHTPRARS
jgi:hypothetical protein